MSLWAAAKCRAWIELTAPIAYFVFADGDPAEALRKAEETLRSEEWGA